MELSIVPTGDFCFLLLFIYIFLNSFDIESSLGRPGSCSWILHLISSASILPAMKRRSQLNPEPHALAGAGETVHAEAITRLPGFLLVGLLSNTVLLLMSLQMQTVPRFILLPVQAFLAISGYRCAFPNRYNGCVVWRDTILSSIFVTRALATLSEMAWLSTLSQLLRDISPAPWTETVAVAMVIICGIAQLLVWAALLLETDRLMVYEEVCWAAMFILNTGASGSVVATGSTPGALGDCALYSLAFGTVYLPWQCLLHIPALGRPPTSLSGIDFTLAQAAKGGRRAMFFRKTSTRAADWGGLVGAVWMFACVTVCARCRSRAT